MVGPWGPTVRGGGAARGASGGRVGRVVFVWGHGLRPSLVAAAAGGVRPHSLWRARQGSGISRRRRSLTRIIHEGPESPPRHGVIVAHTARRVSLPSGAGGIATNCRCGGPGYGAVQRRLRHGRARCAVGMVPVAAPGGAPGELILANLVRGQRSGPRVAAEERGEMGGPAAGGAVGPELPDVVVLEVGVAEGPQGRPLGAEGARWRCRAGGVGGAQRVGRVVSCGGMGCVPPWWRPRQAASVHIRSGGRDREVESAEATVPKA